MKPIHRSRLRLTLGKWWFTGKRYCSWIFGSDRLAAKRTSSNLSYSVTRHSTPIYRPLRNVEKWLQVNKVRNLSLAVLKLDGLLIRPGETFSYWRTIGKPTKRKGYVEGMVLFYGSFRPGVGGGLCQMSNLIYWIALHTPLEVVERHRHSYDVFPDANRTQPFGSGATCAYNYLDLKLYNASPHTYQLRVRLTDSELVGEWRCDASPAYRYEIYEKEHRIFQEPWGGYVRHNVIHRREYSLTGELVRDRFITENRALMMYSPLLENKPVTFEDNTSANN
ncbi:VanW family protein [Paenibacillus tarimensis]